MPRPSAPHISEKDATAAALRQLQPMNPKVTGYSLVSARYDPAPDKVYDDGGNLIGSESHSSCLVFMFQGPGWLCQNQFGVAREHELKASNLGTLQT